MFGINTKNIKQSQKIRANSIKNSIYNKNITKLNFNEVQGEINNYKINSTAFTINKARAKI